jgi:hypothetical protein
VLQCCNRTHLLQLLGRRRAGVNYPRVQSSGAGDVRAARALSGREKLGVGVGVCPDIRVLTIPFIIPCSLRIQINVAYFIFLSNADLELDRENTEKQIRILPFPFSIHIRNR